MRLEKEARWLSSRRNLASLQLIRAKRMARECVCLEVSLQCDIPQVALVRCWWLWCGIATAATFANAADDDGGVCDRLEQTRQNHSRAECCATKATSPKPHSLIRLGSLSVSSLNLETRATPSTSCNRHRQTSQTTSNGHQATQQVAHQSAEAAFLGRHPDC